MILSHLTSDCKTLERKRKRITIDFFWQSILWKDNDLFFCFYGERPSCSGAVCRTVFLSLYRYFSRTHQGQVRGMCECSGVLQGEPAGYYAEPKATRCHSFVCTHREKLAVVLVRRFKHFVRSYRHIVWIPEAKRGQVFEIDKSSTHKRLYYHDNVYLSGVLNASFALTQTG